MSRGNGGNPMSAAQHGTQRHTGGNVGGTNSESVVTRNSDFGSFLGDVPSFTGKQRAEEAFSRETWDMPDKYQNEVAYLTHVLDFFIIDQAEFWCKKILPFARTDQLHFQWNVWKFDRTIADIEPHQGVPRLVTSSRQSRSSSLIRRGLAFMIEHGFYNTDQGRETFALNIKQITDAVHTTCYSDVLHSLLSCDAYYKQWERKFGVHSSRQSDILRQERRRWGIVSKSSRGMYLLDADLKRAFRREGIVPDCWVWPDRMSVYLHMNHDNEVDYARRGPGAYEQLASGKIQNTFRGLPVYTSFPLDVDFNGAPISLLERDRQIGEWFYIRQDEDIRIFSATTDKFETISWDDAVKADLRRKSASDPSKRIATDTDFDPDAPILIFRPFQTWRMASALLLKSGSDLGNTFHGHHDMQLQNDAIRKIMVGHYTFYSRAVVKNPKCVNIVEDVMANDYIGGEDASFYNRDTFRDEWMEQKIGTKEATKSLIAWSMGKKWQASKPDKMPEAIDLLGAFPASSAGQTLASERHFPDANLLEDILTLQQLRPARDAEAELYLKSMLPLNTVMFRGHTLRRKTSSATPSQKEWKVTEIGRGHWGSNIYPGCASHRVGMSGDGFLQPQNIKQMDF